jgi:hypothetical protein
MRPSTRIPIVLSTFLLCTSMLAQAPASVDATPKPHVEQHPSMNDAPPQTNEADGAQRRPLLAETNVDGAGAVYTDASVYTTSGVMLDATPTYPNIAARLGDNGTSAFTVFARTGDPLLRVRGEGNVLIGATSPAAKLNVLSRTPNFAASEFLTSTAMTVTGSQNDRGGRDAVFQNIAAGVTNSGFVSGALSQGYLVGGGTLAAAYGAQVDVGISGTSTGTITNAYGTRTRVVTADGTITNAFAHYISQVQGTNGYGVYVTDLEAANAYAFYSAGATDKVFMNGSVGIGIANPAAGVKLHVVGDARFDGTVTGTNIRAKYQDVAEWVPATEDMVPGTVVVLNPAATNEVMPSHRQFDTTVAGVVSEQPGVILGAEGPKKEQIATTGRVKVRVDATRGAIRVGDLLVTSDRPGIAMRSTPVEVNGIELHRPGTILGKALEPLADGVGEILVLLSLQ